MLACFAGFAGFGLSLMIRLDGDVQVLMASRDTRGVVLAVEADYRPLSDVESLI